jgi:2-methylfumaryl-CoA isomerase
LGNPDVVNHVLPAWDLITGQTIALGLLAAERQRSRSGAGQHIKLALEDVALAVMGHLGYIAEAQLGQERARIGNHLFGAFGRDFRTADGERVMVVGLTGKQWRSLCDATESVEQMALLGQRLDLDLDQEGNRFRARNEISEVVAAWIGARPFADVAAQFDRHGVCWGRYQSVTQLVQRDPSCSVANPMFARVEQPGVGTLLMPSTPLDFSAAPRVAPRPAPRLGEHTEQVLHELLGIDAAAFGRLHDRGVVAARAEPA